MEMCGDFCENTLEKGSSDLEFPNLIWICWKIYEISKDFWKIVWKNEENQRESIVRRRRRRHLLRRRKILADWNFAPSPSVLITADCDSIRILWWLIKRDFCCCCFLLVLEMWDSSERVSLKKYPRNPINI